MANTKKLIQAAAGAAGGGEGLNVEQVFSTYLYEGNGSSQVIENGINLGQSYGSGSVKFADGTNGGNPAGLDFASASELAMNDFTVEANYFIEDSINIAGFGCIGTYQAGLDIRIYPAGPFVYLLGSSYSSTSSMSAGNWYHIAIVRSGSSLYVYIDGTRVNTHSVSSSALPQANGSVGGIVSGSLTTNTSFMSNFRISNTARYTGASFTAPTSDFTSDANTMLLALQGDTPLADTSSYARTLTPDTTDGSTVTASTFGPFDAADAGEGGLVWIKERTSTSSHILVDTERGAGKYIGSNTTSPEVTNTTTISDLNADGFTVGSSGATGQNGEDYASWTFRKAPKFFDVVTYTGDGVAGREIAHNLGTDVGAIFVKSTSGTGDWAVYHRGVDSTAPEDYFLVLNGSDERVNNINRWNDTAPTSTEFTLGNSIRVNESSVSYVAYLFAHNDGDGEFGPDGDADIIKCGSYTGNGSTDGPEIDLGFEPQWVLLKGASSSGNWLLYDVMRGLTVGTTNAGADQLLQPHTANAEYTDYHLSPTSTGFKVRDTGGDTNTSGGTYIYIAIRRGPMAVPESATDVFDVNIYNATGVAGNPQTTGFPVDLAIIGQRDATDSWKHGVLTRLTGAVNYLVTSSTSAEGSAGGGINIDNMTGYDFQSGAFNTASPAGMYNLNWKRAPNYFDVVAYTGNGTAGRTVSHNLGVAPEMMWVKSRNFVDNWMVYHSGIGPTKALFLETTDAENTNTVWWNNTAPTASDFTVGSNFGVNRNGFNFIAYLFASLDGVSKVFSVTKSSGSDASVNCGFSSGPRFVILKRTDSAGDWYVWDTERGIVAGNDPYLLLNSTAAEVTSTDYIDPTSNGFTIVNGGLADGDYIGYAVA